MRRTLILTTAAVLTLGTASVAPAAGTGAGTAAQAQQPTTMSQPEAGDMTAMQGLLGRDVMGSDGNRLGRIADVVLTSGNERANVAVIETQDGKSIAVDYTLLDVGGDAITARTVTRDQVAAMPAFEYDDSMVSIGRKAGTAPAQ